MKIGILTQPLVMNYGGILQNYALQTVLKRMGHDVWTFDISKYTWKNWIVIAMKVLVRKLFFQKASFPLTPTQRKLLGVNLKKFIDTNISLTIPNLRWYDSRIVEKYEFDAIIVGSDQTWRPIYNLKIEDMYLEFLKGMDLKRLAYASSFGTDYWEYDRKQTDTCANLAQMFDAISVREQSGIDLCKKYLHVNATHVLDPTLLLSSTDYRVVCSSIEKQNPFVFAYILDLSTSKVAAIKQFAISKGLPYKIVGADAKIGTDDSIEKWLSCFRDADYVVTDSFHGTAFSINFNKDFFVYSNEGRGNSRFNSLLGLLGLENRIIKNETTDLCSCKSIDWEVVNKSLDKERQTSYTWLLNSLKLQK